MRLFRVLTTLVLAVVLLPIALYVAGASGLSVGFQVLIALLLVVPPMVFRRIGASAAVLAFAVLALMLVQGWAGVFLAVFSALGAIGLAAWPVFDAARARHSVSRST